MTRDDSPYRDAHRPVFSAAMSMREKVLWLAQHEQLYHAVRAVGLKDAAAQFKGVTPAMVRRALRMRGTVIPRATDPTSETP